MKATIKLRRRIGIIMAMIAVSAVALPAVDASKEESFRLSESPRHVRVTPLGRELCDVSPREQALIGELYSRDRAETSAEYRERVLIGLRQRIADRPVEQRERRIALVPCVYRDTSGKLLAWGLDLPQPDRKWVTVEKTFDSTVPLSCSVVRLVESVEHQCWVAVAWHQDWKIVPPHGSVTCLTNAVALVAVPKGGE